jgi:hypothetical protein
VSQYSHGGDPTRDLTTVARDVASVVRDLTQEDRSLRGLTALCNKAVGRACRLMQPPMLALTWTMGFPIMMLKEMGPALILAYVWLYPPFLASWAVLALTSFAWVRLPLARVVLVPIGVPVAMLHCLYVMAIAAMFEDDNEIRRLLAPALSWPVQDSPLPATGRIPHNKVAMRGPTTVNAMVELASHEIVGARKDYSKQLHIVGGAVVEQGMAAHRVPLAEILNLEIGESSYLLDESDRQSGWIEVVPVHIRARRGEYDPNLGPAVAQEFIRDVTSIQQRARLLLGGRTSEVYEAQVSIRGLREYRFEGSSSVRMWDSVSPGDKARLEPLLTDSGGPILAVYSRDHPQWILTDSHVIDLQNHPINRTFPGDPSRWPQAPRYDIAKIHDLDYESELLMFSHGATSVSLHGGSTTQRLFWWWVLHRPEVAESVVLQRAFHGRALGADWLTLELGCARGFAPPSNPSGRLRDRRPVYGRVVVRIVAWPERGSKRYFQLAECPLCRTQLAVAVVRQDIVGAFALTKDYRLEPLYGQRYYYARESTWTGGRRSYFLYRHVPWQSR